MKDVYLENAIANAEIKTNRWCFTMWEIPTPRNRENIQFMIWQREQCPKTKSIHYQGYIEFKKPYIQRQVKFNLKCKNAHIEPARESRAVNMFYCLKPNTYHGLRLLHDDDGKVHTFNLIDEILSEQDINEFDLDDIDEIFNHDGH